MLGECRLQENNYSACRTLKWTIGAWRWLVAPLITPLVHSYAYFWLVLLLRTWKWPYSEPTRTCFEKDCGLVELWCVRCCMVPLPYSICVGSISLNGVRGASTTSKSTAMQIFVTFKKRVGLFCPSVRKLTYCSAWVSRLLLCLVPCKGFWWLTTICPDKYMFPQCGRCIYVKASLSLSQLSQ